MSMTLSRIVRTRKDTDEESFAIYQVIPSYQTPRLERHL